MSIDRARLFTILDAIPLDAGRWLVTGSAPMLAMGIIESIHDVDIVADVDAWQAAVSISRDPPRRGLFGDRLVGLEVDGSAVEVFDGWLGTDAEQMIGEGVEIDGRRFSPIERVLDSKRRLLRPRDQRHIEILERHSAEWPTTNGR